MLTLVVFAGLLLWLFRPIWNIDIFWHVVVGRLILEGGVPTQDVLSAAHPEAPWRTFQWGYELGVAVLDGLGGLRLVQAVHVLVMSTAGAGLFEVLRRRASAAGRRSQRPGLGGRRRPSGGSGGDDYVDWRGGGSGPTAASDARETASPP